MNGDDDAVYGGTTDNDAVNALWATLVKSLLLLLLVVVLSPPVLIKMFDDDGNGGGVNTRINFGRVFILAPGRKCFPTGEGVLAVVLAGPDSDDQDCKLFGTVWYICDFHISM